MRSINKKAFTLAEVLITLGIIGVVAAMTIPTLISNISRKQHLVAFKKKYAEITEAIKLSVIDNSETIKWDYTLDDDEFFAVYLAPYLKTNKCNDCWISYVPKAFWFETPAFAAPMIEVLDCFKWYETIDGADSFCADLLQECMDNGEVYGFFGDECKAWVDAQKPSNIPPDEPNVSYNLVNGSILGLAKMDSFFYLYLDVNGTASPNVYGADKFVFTVNNSKVLPYGYGQEDLASGDFGCSADGNGMYCGALIMRNNWDYTEDYPKL